MPCTRKQYSNGGSGSMEFSPLRAGEGEGLASGKFWCTKRAESNVLQLILLNVYTTLVPPSIIMTKAARSTAIMCQTWEVSNFWLSPSIKYLEGIEIPYGGKHCSKQCGHCNVCRLSRNQCPLSHRMRASQTRTYCQSVHLSWENGKKFETILIEMLWRGTQNVSVNCTLPKSWRAATLRRSIASIRTTGTVHSVRYLKIISSPLSHHTIQHKQYTLQSAVSNWIFLLLISIISIYNSN